MLSSDEISASTIQTFSGKMFDVFNPDTEKIDLGDISHALSMLCRYGGHCHRFYSVAEHSVLMAGYFWNQGRHDLALVALFHDATEAYMGDLVRPLKLQMPLYQETERKLQSMIFWKFGLPLEIPVEVKDADLRICNDERAVLLDERPWSESIDSLAPLAVEVQCWSPARAEQEWLKSYWRLVG